MAAIPEKSDVQLYYHKFAETPADSINNYMNSIQQNQQKLSGDHLSILQPLHAPGWKQVMDLQPPDKFQWNENADHSTKMFSDLQNTIHVLEQKPPITNEQQFFSNEPTNTSPNIDLSTPIEIDPQDWAVVHNIIQNTETPEFPELKSISKDVPMEITQQDVLDTSDTIISIPPFKVSAQPVKVSNP